MIPRMLVGKRLLIAHINGVLVPFVYKPTSRNVPFASGRLTAQGPQVQLTSAVIPASLAGAQLAALKPLVSSRKHYGLRPKYLLPWHSKLSALAPNHPLYARRAEGAAAFTAPAVRTNVTRIEVKVAAAGASLRTPVVTSAPRRLFAHNGLPYGRLAGKKIIVLTSYIYKPAFAAGQWIFAMPLMIDGLTVPPSVHGCANVQASSGFVDASTFPPTLLLQAILNAPSGGASCEFISPQHIETLTALLYELALSDAIDWALKANLVALDIGYELSLADTIEFSGLLSDAVLYPLLLNPEVVVNLVQRN